MLQYTLKRLLLVLPTFFLISLLIFLVLNVAPGRPGAVAAEGGGEKGGQEQKESYRIFKEQFNLDKPILLNTRPWMDKGEVKRMLQQADPKTAGVKPAERLAASDALDDHGEYLVPHLIALLDDPEIQARALLQLPVAAQQRFVNDRRGDPVQARAKNREIARENEAAKALRPAEDTPEAVAATVQAWKSWYEGNRARYEHGAGEKLRRLFLDTRFARYWDNLLHLDFGVSTVDRRPVMETVLSKLKYSLSLSTLSVVLAYLVAVPIGIWSAVRQGSRADAAMTVLLFILYSLPTFFTGTVLLKLFTEGEPWSIFPTGNFQSMSAGPMTTWDTLLDIAWHLVLPIVTYTSVALASLSRYARSGVIDVIRADYIRTARAKGLSEPMVILKHAARNGMIPILTLLGSLLPSLVAGSVVIEVVFNIPGMGMYLYNSINLRDYNAVMAVLLASSLLALLGILVSDLSYAIVDPRISLD